jgi:hypothetical protein
MIRSLLAIMGGLALTSLLTQVLEVALVSAVSSNGFTDLPGYFAVRNSPGVFAAVLASSACIALLGGYTAAKVAGERELAHGAAIAFIQTAALVWGSTVGEVATLTPLWMRVASVLTTGPAMFAGALIRARAMQQGATEEPGL